MATDFTGHPAVDAERITELLGRPADLRRRLVAATASRPGVVVLYIEGLVNTGLLQRDVVEPLLTMARQAPGTVPWGERVPQVIRTASLRTLPTAHEAAGQLLRGWAVVLAEGMPLPVGGDVSGWPTRAIEEPPSEVVTKGPRSSFVEELRQNLALLRITFPSPQLRAELFSCGRMPPTQTALVWLAQRTPPPRVATARRLLGRLQEVRGPLDAQTVAEHMGHRGLRVLPIVFQTERPDRVAAALREGRVAIFIDRSPFVVVAPASFFTLLTSGEDYYQPPEVALALRLTRWIAFGLAVAASPAYIGFAAYNPGVLPTRLAVAVAASRESVPYPAWVEAVLMEMMMTVLVEASVRLPRAIGSAATVVGGLIIGQAAAQASLISNLMIIVVAVSAITSFAMPNVELLWAVRVFKWPMMLAAGVMGLPGAYVAFLVGTLWMVAQRSLEEPYFWPLAPFDARAFWKDAFLRQEWSSLQPGELEPQAAGKGRDKGPAR